MASSGSRYITFPGNYGLPGLPTTDQEPMNIHSTEYGTTHMLKTFWLPTVILLILYIWLSYNFLGRNPTCQFWRVLEALHWRVCSRCCFIGCCHMYIVVDTRNLSLVSTSTKFPPKLLSWCWISFVRLRLELHQNEERSLWRMQVCYLVPTDKALLVPRLAFRVVISSIYSLPLRSEGLFTVFGTACWELHKSKGCLAVV